MQPDHHGEAVQGDSNLLEADVPEQVDMNVHDSAPMDQQVDVNTSTEHVNTNV